MSKEKLDEVMAAPRARKVRAQAEVAMSELDCQILTLESEAQELCINKEINFDNLFSKIDRRDLLERRKKQYAEILGQLFPEDAKKTEKGAS